MRPLTPSYLRRRRPYLRSAVGRFTLHADWLSLSSVLRAHKWSDDLFTSRPDAGTRDGGAFEVADRRPLGYCP